MEVRSLLSVRADVAEALRQGQPVVALESSLITHGLPWPVNLQTAQAAEAVIREEGAIPATIAVLNGRPTVGLSEDQLEQLAKCEDAIKSSRRDLAFAVVQRRTAATTVAATMYLASLAGVRIFATGGIGGAHRDNNPWDISADLTELAPAQITATGV